MADEEVVEGMCLRVDRSFGSGRLFGLFGWLALFCSWPRLAPFVAGPGGIDARPLVPSYELHLTLGKQPPLMRGN